MSQEKKEEKNENSLDESTNTKSIKEHSVEVKSSEDKTQIEKFEEIKEVYELKLKEKDKSIEDWRKKFILLQADFENYQKRMEKNKLHIQNIERISILRDLLKIMDSFEKALEHLEKSPNINSGSIKSIYNQLLGWFKSYDVVPISVSIGDIFDYKIHEAISYLENPDLPENSIIDIVQTGWKIGKEILRYTKVVISKLPKKPEKEEEKDEAKKETDKTD